MNAIKIYRLFAWIFFLTAVTFSAWGNEERSPNGPENSRDDVEYTFSKDKKEISKSFSVSANDNLSVENRYGDITITHWNNKEVNIRVVISADARTDSRVEELIDRIQISMDKSGRTVSASTSLRSSTNSGNNERFKIDYYISMPSKMSVNISHRYGNINLPDRNEGEMNLEIRYGNITAGSFEAPLSLTSRYGNVSIRDVTKADFDLSYCEDMKMRNGEKVSIHSRYSNLKVNDVADLSIEARYKNIEIGRVETLYLETRYTNSNIEYIGRSADISTLDYGTLKVKELSSGFKSFSVETRYGNVQIGLSPSARFDVSAENMKYADYSIRDFEESTDKDNSGRKSYYSRINKGDKSRLINFSGNGYSDLTIKHIKK